MARLRLPAGWKFGTALPVAATSGAAADVVEFRPASLETADRLPGRRGRPLARTIPLGSGDGGAPHVIDAVADSEEALAMTPQQLAAYKQLVAEAGALFGAHHWPRLPLPLFAERPGHERSASSTTSRATIGWASARSIEDDRRRAEAELLPHEFVHSWNGKYRRPAGLATADYQEPMRGELLWVYEGLTAVPRSGS